MSVLTACDRRSENITQAPERFPQGVASGDPQTNRVALWTRCPPVDVVGDNQAQDVSDLVMQVALDDAFENLVAEEKIAAAVDDDHTVRVIVEGLEPRHTYFTDSSFPAGSPRPPVEPRQRRIPRARCR